MRFFLTYITSYFRSPSINLLPWKSLLLVVIAAIALTACSSNSSKKGDLASKNEQQLYKSSQYQLKRGFFEDAIETLQIMESRYPFGEYSKSAQLSLIYAYYGFEEPESAIASANRFIRLHPQYRHVDYAYYMKGLIAFPEAKTLFQRFFNVDLSKRDINEARTSINHFSTLVKRFPNSEYAPDSLKRMEFLRNLLARHEIHVANYYLKRKAYLAAVNRGKYVIENFQSTTAIPDALAVMAQSYHEMNMPELAETSIQTLVINYPNHPALNQHNEFDFGYSTRKDSNYLLDTMTLGLLGNHKPPGFNTEKLYNPIQK